LVVGLVEEIILIVYGCEVVLSSGLASEGFTVTNLLKVVQTAGDTENREVYSTLASQEDMDAF